MDLEDVGNPVEDRRDGWHGIRRSATLVIMDMEDEEEARLWDEIAGITESER